MTRIREINIELKASTKALEVAMSKTVRGQFEEFNMALGKLGDAIHVELLEGPVAYFRHWGEGMEEPEIKEHETKIRLIRLEEMDD